MDIYFLRTNDVPQKDSNVMTMFVTWMIEKALDNLDWFCQFTFLIPVKRSTMFIGRTKSFIVTKEKMLILRAKTFAKFRNFRTL